MKYRLPAKRHLASGLPLPAPLTAIPSDSQPQDRPQSDAAVSCQPWSSLNNRFDWDPGSC